MWGGGGGEESTGRAEERSRIQNVQDCTELRNTGEQAGDLLFSFVRASPPSLAALLPWISGGVGGEGGASGLGCALCHSTEKLHLSVGAHITYVQFEVCGSRFADWRSVCLVWGSGFCTPPSRLPSLPSDSTGVPSQAQPKHCSLGKGRGCSPIAQ